MALSLQGKLHSFISPKNRKLLFKLCTVMFAHSLDPNSVESKGILGHFSLSAAAAQTMKSYVGISAFNPPQLVSYCSDLPLLSPAIRQYGVLV